jgi:hypothetical protein
VPEEFSSDFVWGLHDIGAAAGVYKKDGSVNTKVTRDRVIAGIIPAWKRNGVWQSAHSVINQALTTATEISSRVSRANAIQHRRGDR